MKIETTTTENLTLENSFGAVRQENGVEMNYTVRLQPNKNYGSFEMYDEKTGGSEWYAEGGLWFEGKELVEYEGVFELSQSIIEILEENGYDASYAK